MNELELHVFLRPRGLTQASVEYESDDGFSFAYRSGVSSRFRAEARARGSELSVRFVAGPHASGPFRVRLVLYGAFTQVTVQTAHGKECYVPRRASWRFAGSPLRIWKTPIFSLGSEAEG